MDYGVQVVFRPGFHQKFTVIDGRISRYGSVNILGYHFTEDNIITFHDADTAKDILEMLYR